MSPTDAPPRSATPAAAGQDLGRRRYRLQALIVSVVSLVVLAVVAISVHSSPARQGGFLGPATRHVQERKQKGGYDEPVWDTYDQSEPPDLSGHEDLGRLLLIGAISLAILVVLIIAVLVLRRAGRLWAPVRHERIEVDEEPMITVVEAREALRHATARLDRDTAADDAIIAAWLAIENALTAAGVRRAMSETTREYVVRALGALELDARELSALAELYRRALFAGRDTTEADRDRARDLLTSLTSQLPGASR